MTGLCGRDQRALGQIEAPLAAADPRLATMFAVFADMTRHDPMPASERLTPRLRRWLHRARVIMGTLLSTMWAPAGVGAYDPRWVARGGR